MAQKHFNSYKEGLDLEFLRQYCLEHGEVKMMEQGEALEKAGEPARWIAYVEQGFFKYMVHNDKANKDCCTGFAFEGELVADYPFCLVGKMSEVTIEAGMECKVHIIDACELQQIFKEDAEKARIGTQITEHLFYMVYSRYLDNFRYDARERYKKLLSRCPQIVQQLPLKDIASFLGITSCYLSTIRKKPMLNEKK